MKYIINTLAFVTGLALLVAGSPVSAGWLSDTPNNADKKMSDSLERLVAEIDRMNGLPSIVNGFEKRMVKMLYELRDDPEFRTYSYVMTMTGEFVKICDSIGYGINASIQYSNPQKLLEDVDLGQGFGTLPVPQAEPNGLFMPEGLAATYALCLHPEKEEITAVYVEPELIVSPFPLIE